MSIKGSVPALFWWLVWFVVSVLLVILAALIVHHFGGFSFAFHVGYFHLQFGVR